MSSTTEKRGHVPPCDWAEKYSHIHNTLTREYRKTRKLHLIVLPTVGTNAYSNIHSGWSVGRLVGRPNTCSPETIRTCCRPINGQPSTHPAIMCRRIYIVSLCRHGCAKRLMFQANSADSQSLPFALGDFIDTRLPQ